MCVVILIQTLNLSLQIYWLEIDGVRLNFSIFEKDQSETSASIVGGIFYTSDYYDVPQHLGFSNRGSFDVDQKHKVSIVIPKQYYEVDGALNFKFQVLLDAHMADESMGIDNIVLSSRCCVPSFLVSEEDFEDGIAVGWSNGKIESTTLFTKFLGRFGIGDNTTSKTFDVPMYVDEITIEYDMYEIDSWDRLHNDRYYAIVDGRTLDFGLFSMDTTGATETRNGQTDGITWTHTFSEKAEMGFATFGNMDEKHAVVITVPSSYFALDRMITVQFVASFSEAISNEALGIDNVKIRAHNTCPTASPTAGPTVAPTANPTSEPTSTPTSNPTAGPTETPTVSPTATPTARPTAIPTAHPTYVPSQSFLPSCVGDQVLYFEDFESVSSHADTNWTNGLLAEEVNCTYFTKFLGRYTGMNTTLWPLPEKTFSGIPTASSMLKLEFDFYEIDSWDTEPLSVQVNNDTILLGTFRHQTNEGTTSGFSGISGDIAFTTKSDGGVGFRCFNTIREDQIHHVTISLPSRIFASGSIFVKFVPGIDSGLHDESLGIDNIKLTSQVSC